MQIKIIPGSDLLRDVNSPEFEAKLRDSEDLFRRGYYHGYSDAMDDFLELHTHKGFARFREAWNILARHFDTALLKWRRSAFTCPRNMVKRPPPSVSQEEWQSIRTRILRRDRCCVRCGDVLRLEVDHIHEVQDGGLPTDDNLRVLCKACHATKFQWNQ